MQEQTLNGDAHQTKRDRLRSELMQEIETQDLSPHAQFYTETALCQRFTVSRQTIRQVLDDLQTRGLIYRIRGKGTFVAPKAKLKQYLLVTPPDAYNTQGYNQLYTTFGFIKGFNDADGESVPLAITTDQFNELSKDMSHTYRNLAGVLFLEKSPKIDSLNELERMGVPYLFYGSDSNLPTFPKYDIPYYVYHEAEVVHAALSYLHIERGHNRIGMIYTDTVESKRKRRDLWLNWMEARDLLVSQEWAIEYRYLGNLQDETEYIQEMLLDRRDLTAVFCSEDKIAMVTVNAAIRAGLREPEDLAIVGVNNYDFTRRAIVPITTVGIPWFEDAQRCTKILRRLKSDPLCGNMKSPVTLIRRNSA